MNVEGLRLAWDVITTIGTFIALSVAWWVKRWAAPKKDLDEMSERLARIEERVSHLPTDHDLVDVRDGLARLGAQIADLAGEQRATTRLVESINQYLMERKL